MPMMRDASCTCIKPRVRTDYTYALKMHLETDSAVTLVLVQPLPNLSIVPMFLNLICKCEAASLAKSR